jgi:uncharacterized protein involved in response to NO
MLINIETPYPHKTAFLQLGFRPFFSAAMVIGVLAIAIWMVFYFTNGTLPAVQYPTTLWHAHEMIFGYGTALAAGFLLTAIRNWTGLQTLQNKPLLLLFSLWCVARILPFILPYSMLWLLALVDLSFNLFLAIAMTVPIYKAKQWKNSAFPGKMFFLLIANSLFYIGLLGLWSPAMQIGLYIGFYTLVGLIFTLGRRVIPFFIQSGVDYSFTAKNWKWLDISNLVFFLCFSIADIADGIYVTSLLTACLAGILFILNSIRLYGWYTHGIWKKTLLWSLYIGYSWLVFGFLLKFLMAFLPISPFLAIHAFAYGGIGLITIGMMARISLGHTGRNVSAPPKILNWVYSLLAIGAVVRVIFPLFNSSLYPWWIGIAQALWIISFTLLLITYLPLFIKPRIDGKAG